MSLKIKSAAEHWDHIPIKEEGGLVYVDHMAPSHIKDIDRVTRNPDSEEETRVLLQLKILRRNDAGKDHSMIVDFDSGKADCITICDELQKGAGKLSLTIKEINMLHYVVRECHAIASMAQGGGNNDSPF